MKQRYTHDFQARNPQVTAQSGGPAQNSSIPLAVRVVPKIQVPAKRRGSTDGGAATAAPKRPSSPRLEENEPYVKVEQSYFVKAKKPMFREVQVGEAKDNPMPNLEDSDRESVEQKGPIKGWFIQGDEEVARPSTTITQHLVSKIVPKPVAVPKVLVPTPIHGSNIYTVASSELDLELLEPKKKVNHFKPKVIKKIPLKYNNKILVGSNRFHNFYDR